MAKKGVDVIVTHHSSESEANSLVSAIAQLGCKAVALQLDIGNTQNFDPFVAVKRSLQETWQIEQFDFLVNNAELGINKPFAKTTESDLDRFFTFIFN